MCWRKEMNVRKCVLLAGLWAMSMAASADHFGFDKKGDGAVVLAHGYTIFEITAPAGGMTPVERARAIAQRLDEIVDLGKFDPTDFALDTSRGMVVIAYRGHNISQSIVTIDKGTVNANRVNAKQLGSWWLALLQDHLLLAKGLEPDYMARTHTGEVLKTWFRRAQLEKGPWDERLDHARRELTTLEVEALYDCHSRKGLLDYIDHFGIH